MNFTWSFVLEILIGGCFCSIWVVLLINKIVGGTLTSLLEFLSNALNVGTSGIFLELISIYVLGWISQYMCDLIFDNLFEKKIKGNPFKVKEDFYHARGIVLQEGSEAVLDDIQTDRQLLRLSKLICLNFSLIFIFGFFYANESVKFSLIVGTVSVALSVISFLQWKKRYISVMYKIRRAEQSILASKKRK